MCCPLILSLTFAAGLPVADRARLSLGEAFTLASTLADPQSADLPARNLLRSLAEDALREAREEGGPRPLARQLYIVRLLTAEAILRRRLPPGSLPLLWRLRTAAQVARPIDPEAGAAAVLRPVREKLPGLWSTLRRVPAVTGVIVGAVAADDRSIRISVDEPTIRYSQTRGEHPRLALGQTITRSNLVEIRLAGSLGDAAQSDSALPTLVFEALNSQDAEIVLNVQNAARTGRIGRYDYIWTLAVLESIAGAETQRVLDEHREDIRRAGASIDPILWHTWPEVLIRYSADRPHWLIETSGYPHGVYGTLHDWTQLQSAARVDDLHTWESAVLLDRLRFFGAEYGVTPDYIRGYDAYLSYHAGFTFGYRLHAALPWAARRELARLDCGPKLADGLAATVAAVRSMWLP